MDDGYTEHSGCPVISGEKWITTAWLREGVTAEDNADLYDPEGIKILSSDEYYPSEPEAESEEGSLQEQEVGLTGEREELWKIFPSSHHLERIKSRLLL